MYRITKSSSILNYGAISYPSTGMVNVNPDIEKLKNIGWKPEVTFEEGIKRIINCEF
jgi:nucleoside-diphosphate-sugar epimerase